MESTPFDAPSVRRDFPALRQQVYGKPWIYLDSAATAQKPQAVLDALIRADVEFCSNIHRGVHWVSARATQAYEEARDAMQGFIHAPSRNDIIFVRGTTEAINLVAQTYGRTHVGRGDEVLISAMEHHSNIVPWQMLCAQTGAQLRVIPMQHSGELDLAAYAALLSNRTKILAITHVSNALGTINPLRQIIEQAHQFGVPVVVDGAQAAPHMQVDVQALDCDFYAFSGHKLLGPTGIGVLYGKSHLLAQMPPYQGGGDMIETVRFDKTTYREAPYKFEAGTPAIAAALGLHAAVAYIGRLGLAAIADHEQMLLRYATQALQKLADVEIIGTAQHKAGVVSFTMGQIHPHDIGTVLDQDGIAIRAGHHCAQPVMEFYQVPATARASFALYNTVADIDALVASLQRVHRMFSPHE